eukprot:351362-Chlamydomonas_euryale.AAC.6
MKTDASSGIGCILTSLHGVCHACVTCIALRQAHSAQCNTQDSEPRHQQPGKGRLGGRFNARRVSAAHARAAKWQLVATHGLPPG